jgi:hypothetical protein
VSNLVDSWKIEREDPYEIKDQELVPLVFRVWKQLRNTLDNVSWPRKEKKKVKIRIVVEVNFMQLFCISLCKELIGSELNKISLLQMLVIVGPDWLNKSLVSKLISLHLFSKLAIDLLHVVILIIGFHWNLAHTSKFVGVIFGRRIHNIFMKIRTRKTKWKI